MNKIVIVGGGVIGLFTAFYLHKGGADVTVIDRGDFTTGCSHQNAGLIVPSHVIPLASPGMLKHGMKNLFRSSSPIAARISPEADLLRWYLRFVKTASHKHVRASIPVLKELSFLSKRLYTELKDTGELDFPLWHKGLLVLYKSEKTGAVLIKEAAIARDAGLLVTELSALDVQKLEPMAQLNVSGGLHYKHDDHLDPALLMKNIISLLKEFGVKLVENCPAESILTSGSKAVGLKTGKGLFEFDQLVITSGIWSSKILKQLKTRIYVQPGKGYSFKSKTSGLIHYPALLADANVAVTPFSKGITQFSGGMELGFGDTETKQKRIQHISKWVGEFYELERELNVAPEQIWHGHRPCSFDGLPYIGEVQAFPNVCVGTGHSMMGVTLAPATGLLLSQHIFKEKTSVNLEPFRLDR